MVKLFSSISYIRLGEISNNLYFHAYQQMLTHVTKDQHGKVYNRSSGVLQRRIPGKKLVNYFYVYKHYFPLISDALSDCTCLHNTLT